MPTKLLERGHRANLGTPTRAQRSHQPVPGSLGSGRLCCACQRQVSWDTALRKGKAETVTRKPGPCSPIPGPAQTDEPNTSPKCQPLGTGHADTMCGLPSAGRTPGLGPCCLSWLPRPPALESPGHPAGPSEGGLTTAMAMFLVVRAKGGRGTFPGAISTWTPPCEVTPLQKRRLRLGGSRAGPGRSATWRGQDVSLSQGGQNKGPQLGGPQQQTRARSQHQTTGL